MAVIEVKRVGDGSTRTFDNSEIGDGTLLTWVTENDASADGLVRFLNQVQEEGNALSSSLYRYPKIVKNGSLITDENGNPTVEWDGEHDGYEIDFAEYQANFSSEAQTLKLKVSPENLKGAPKTILNSDGLRIWEREGKIHATISNKEREFESIDGTPPNIDSIQTFKGNLYFQSQNDFNVYKFDESSETSNIISLDTEIDQSGTSSLTVYDDKMWNYNEGKGAIKSFSGDKRFVALYVRSGGERVYTVNNPSVNPPHSIIEEFELTTPYDFSTAEKKNKISDISPIGASFLSCITFKPDGTKFYVSTLNSPYEIYEYNLNTPWDLSTFSFNQKIDVSSDFTDQEITNPSIRFKPDGSKFYLCENQDSSNSAGGFIYEYSLNNTWDISSQQLNNTLDITSEAVDPVSLDFKSNGSKLFILQQDFQRESYDYSRVIEYELSQNWSVSNASLNNTYLPQGPFKTNLDDEEHQVQGLWFHEDGKEFYQVALNGEVATFTLANSWDVKSTYYETKNILDSGESGWVDEFNINGEGSGNFFKPDGKKFYVVDFEASRIIQYDLSTAWDVTTASREKEFYIAGHEVSPTSVYIRQDGKKMFIVGTDRDGFVISFNLQVNWDISTATFESENELLIQSVTQGGFDWKGIFFKPDGTKLYIIDNGTKILSFNIPDPWDISSMPGGISNVVNSLDVGAKDDPKGMFIRSDGKKLYIVGSDITGSATDKILEYDLNTAWDISTASFVSEKDTPIESEAEGISLKSDGTKLYITDISTTFEYDLSTPYSLNSATLSRKKLTTVDQEEVRTYIPYNGNLFIAYTGGRASVGGVMRLTDSGLQRDFLTPSELIEDILGDSFQQDVRDVDWFGGGVWRNELYFPLYSTPPTGSSNIGEIILKYNKTSGLTKFFTFGATTNTPSEVRFLTTTAPYKDDLYALPSKATNDAYVLNEPSQTFKEAWRIQDFGSQAVTKVYNEDLYIGNWFGAFTGDVDALYKWDGSQIEKELRTSDGPWQSMGVHKGELWASHAFTGGSTQRKGKGEEVFLKFDKNKNEIVIEAAVTNSLIFLKVEEKTITKSHNIDYTQNNKLRTGLSFGHKVTGERAGVDEVYKGSLREVLKYNTLTKEVFDTFYSDVSAPTVVFRSPTSIDGTASFPAPEVIDTYEVLTSPDGTQGSFNVIKTVSNPSNPEITWQHNGLTQGEDYFYKFRVSRPGTTLTSSTVSAVAEYSQPDPPTVTITNTGATEVTGTIDSDQADRFWNKLEVYRTTTPGGPYNLITSFTGVNTEQTWTDTGLSGGTQYIYVGKAVNTAGPVDSNFSSEVSTTTSIEVSGGGAESDLAIGVDSITTTGDGDLIIGTDSETESTGGDLDIGTN